jgi:hypothetical protein
MEKKPQTFGVRLVKKGLLEGGGSMEMDMSYQLPFKHFAAFIDFMEKEGIRSSRKKNNKTLSP